MKLLAVVLLPPLLLAGCATHDDRGPTPAEIREQTAQATSTATRDAKAVVQGVVEGVKQQQHQHTININHASAADLRSLPGIGDETASRIIANRPYSDSDELLKRHIVSRDEYNRISSNIDAN